VHYFKHGEGKRSIDSFMLLSIKDMAAKKENIIANSLSALCPSRYNKQQ